MPVVLVASVPNHHLREALAKAVRTDYPPPKSFALGSNADRNFALWMNPEGEQPARLQSGADVYICTSGTGSDPRQKNSAVGKATFLGYMPLSEIATSGHCRPVLDGDETDFKGYWIVAGLQELSVPKRLQDLKFLVTGRDIKGVPHGPILARG
jgi:hypothetical protein